MTIGCLCLSNTDTDPNTPQTGHIGFRVLRYALEYGYQVIAVVRSEAKASVIRTHPLLQHKNDLSRISFAIVPDFTASQAFDTAVRGAQYIIHVASPLATEVPPDGGMQPVKALGKASKR